MSVGPYGGPTIQVMESLGVIKREGDVAQAISANMSRRTLVACLMHCDSLRSISR